MIFLELRARFAVLSFPSRKGKFDEKKADSEGSLGRMERNQTLVFPRGMEKGYILHGRETLPNVPLHSCEQSLPLLDSVLLDNSVFILSFKKFDVDLTKQ